MPEPAACDAITSFDASDLPVQIAGEVQDFDELAWVDAHERKHVSRVVPLALAASTEALRDAGIDTAQLSLEQQREIGVVLGSGGGAQEFSEEQVRLWLTGKVKQVSLFCIPSGTMGTLSSEISMRFGLRGMSHVITTGCTSSTDAFGYALRQIQFGFLPMMLVGGVDAPIAPGIMKGFTLMKIMTASWNDAAASAPRGRSPPIATASWWPKARGCSCWKSTSTRARAEREFSPRSRVTARPARPFIACACRSAARSRRAPSRWRWRTRASRPPTSTMSTCTGPRRSSTIASRLAR